MSDCNQTPVRFVNCCDVMNCINIGSEDNSVTVEVNECGVDLSVSGNNLDNILQINDGECIEMVKEFVEGKLVITPVINWNCVAGHDCEICNPPTCPAPIELTVDLV